MRLEQPPPLHNKDRSLRLPTLPFFIGVGFLLASYIGSLVTSALDSYFGFVEVYALLIGLVVLFITVPLSGLAARDRSDGFLAGMLCAGGGAALLAIWPFFVLWVVFPGGDGVHTACSDDLGASGGRIIDIETVRSLFPTQIFCNTTEGVKATVYSGWEAAGLSSVTVLLVAVVAFGIWLMATHGRKAA